MNGDLAVAYRDGAVFDYVQLAHFCAVIRGEAAPRVTARDGLANLRVTEAIAEAARSGTTITLD